MSAYYKDIIFVQEGRLVNARSGLYHVLKADEMPVIDVIFVQTVEPSDPLGAEPVAEISTDGVAPALVSTIHDATGLDPGTPRHPGASFESTGLGKNKGLKQIGE